MTTQAGNEIDYDKLVYRDFGATELVNIARNLNLEVHRKLNQDFGDCFLMDPVTGKTFAFFKNKGKGLPGWVRKAATRRWGVFKKSVILVEVLLFQHLREGWQVQEITEPRPNSVWQNFLNTLSYFKPTPRLVRVAGIAFIVVMSFAAIYFCYVYGYFAFKDSKTSVTKTKVEVTGMKPAGVQAASVTTTQILDLEKKVEEARLARDQAQLELVKANSTLVDLRKDFAVKSDEVANLQNQLATANISKEKFDKLALDLESKNKALEAQVAEVKALELKYSKLVDNNSTMEKEYSKTLNDLLGQKNRLASENEKLQNELTGYKAAAPKVAAKNSEFDNLLGQSKQTASELEQVKRERDDAISKLSKNMDLLTESEKKVSMLSKGVAVSSADANMLRAKIADLESQLKTATSMPAPKPIIDETALSALKVELQQAQAKLAAADQLNKQLSAELAAITLDRNTAKADLLAKVKEIEVLNASLSGGKSAFVAKREAFQKASATLAKATADRDAAKIKLNESKGQEVFALESDLANCKEREKTLTENLDLYNGLLAEVNSRIMQRSVYLAQHNASAKYVSADEERRDSLLKAMDKAKTELAASKSLSQEIVSKLNLANAKTEGLRDDLIAKEAEVAKAKLACEKAQQELLSAE